MLKDNFRKALTLALQRKLKTKHDAQRFLAVFGLSSIGRLST